MPNDRERKSAMEIHTTIKEFSEKMGTPSISPDTPITVIIGTFPYAGDSKNRKPPLPFLHSAVWDDQEGPTDISENTDRYLYDSGDVHGG